MKHLIYLYSLLGLFLLQNCSNEKIKSKNGGEITIMESEKYRSLFPHNAVDAIGITVVNQIFEGLVRFDEKTLQIKPCLAEKWEVSPDQKKYTFHLKKNILFHRDQCFKNKAERIFNADDVLFSYNLMCSYGENNLAFHSTFKDLVIGASEYYIRSIDKEFKGSVAGIKKVDDFTVTFELEKPNPYFLHILALPYASILKEQAYKMYNTNLLVGTGPFAIKNQSSSNISLVKNREYHRKDINNKPLPYLDQINFQFKKSVEDQVYAFNNKQVDIMTKINKGKYSQKLKEYGITASKQEIKEKEMKYMAVSYCGFNTQNPVLKNKKIRQAINYGLDVKQIRKAIGDTSSLESSIKGITPPVFENYKNPNVANYEINIAKAKTLLKEAGYSNGSELGKITLDLNKGRGNNEIIASEIQKQLKQNLNIDIDINIMPFAQKIDKTRDGRSQFFKGGWIADYPHPQNFLSLFYGRDVPQPSEGGPSYPNTTRYKNETFDSLYQKAMNVNLDETYAILQEAEQILMEDAPVIVLWYGKNQNITQNYVENFPLNAMGMMDFSQTWLNKE